MTASSQFTLGTSAATQIVGPGPHGRSALIENLDGSNDVYVGGVGVTTASGVKIGHGAVPLEIPLGDGDALYAPAVAVVVTGP